MEHKSNDFYCFNKFRCKRSILFCCTLYEHCLGLQCHPYLIKGRNKNATFNNCKKKKKKKKKRKTRCKYMMLFRFKIKIYIDKLAIIHVLMCSML